jgi:hypothetical protein
VPAPLIIRFSCGERPYLFWVSAWTGLGGRRRWKLLSKRKKDGGIEVRLVEELAGGARRVLADQQLAPGHPAGWLERWSDTLAEELGVKLARFDLRSIDSEPEWNATVRRLGWWVPADDDA